MSLIKSVALSIEKSDATGIGTDKLKGIENIIAGEYADVRTGGKDANVIDGGGGDDAIDGGLGNDELICGVGADLFVMGAKPAANNVDTIVDF